MKIHEIIEHCGKKYMFVPCGKQCSFRFWSEKDQVFCEDCELPNWFFNKTLENNFGLKEITDKV